MRAAHNSNPVSPHHLIARLDGSFDGASHDVDQPLNAIIHTGLDKLFPSTPAIQWQPRSALAWQFRPKSVLRAGFGVFSDLLPGSVADLVAANPPNVNTFQGGLQGPAGGLAIAPGVPNSAIDSTVAANQAFLAGFRTRRTLVRVIEGKSCELPSARGIDRGPGRHSAHALFPAVESAHRNSSSETPAACACSTSGRAP